MPHPVSGSQMIFYPFAGLEIELIRPADLRGDVARQCLDRRGEGLFHLSFVPDDHDAEVKAWRDKGLSVTELAFESPQGPVRLVFLKPGEIHGLWIEIVDTAKLSEA
jgi:Glyoxalase/Bleomycin resistance protein/Dioxygenase superfamily